MLRRAECWASEKRWLPLQANTSAGWKTRHLCCTFLFVVSLCDLFSFPVFASTRLTPFVYINPTASCEATCLLAAIPRIVQLSRLKSSASCRFWPANNANEQPNTWSTMMFGSCSRCRFNSCYRYRWSATGRSYFTSATSAFRYRWFFALDAALAKTTQQCTARWETATPNYKCGTRGALATKARKGVQVKNKAKLAVVRTDAVRPDQGDTTKVGRSLYFACN